ncbi:uncharacterized protein LOC135281643 isoform X2 [Passer domesticus]|uniref:uncharacterized protein LOC135281643 isoform X2 n=1 Tax=Passer domesticus TaxID=48849 RepID=UPI0030FE0E96
MPFSAARGGVGSAGEGGGRLRWGRRERSLIIRHRPRSCSRPGAERPQQTDRQTGGQAGGARRSERPQAGRGCRGCRAPSAPALLPRIAHLRALRGAVTLGGAGGRAEQRAGSRAGRVADATARCGRRSGCASVCPSVRVCVCVCVCRDLEAEIGGVAEGCRGGASEERGRHRLLLRSAFFLIASGEAAGQEGSDLGSPSSGGSVPCRAASLGPALRRAGLAPRGSSCSSALADGPVRRLCLSFSALSSFRYGNDIVT